MFANQPPKIADDLDDSTTLPELTFYDLLEPPTTSNEQHLNVADNDDDDDIDDDDTEDNDEEDFEDEEYLSTSANDSLNTPRTKKTSVVHILENKRLTAPAPISAALKNMLGGGVKVVTTPTKVTPTTEIKILNKLQAKPIKTFGNAPMRIGSTTIVTPTATSAAGGATTSSATKTIGGVTMTPIKTSDGKLLFVQKSMQSTSGTTSKVTTSATSTRLVTQASTSSSGGIRQTILPKGVTLTSAGLIKNTANYRPITVKGLTTIATSKPTAASTASAPKSTTLVTSPSATAAGTTSAAKIPIQVLRTSDGKLIKFNQGTSTVVINSKSSTVATKPASTPTTTTLSSNVVINKPTAQVIIKGPLKQLPSGTAIRAVINNTSSASSSSTATTTTSVSSSSGSTNVATTATASGSLSAGKLLVQSSTGKQIVVSSKNIIRLSPKPKPGTTVTASTSSPTSTVTTSSVAAPATSSANTTPSGLHAIQLSGKTGVQYVRVLPSNNSNKVITSPQKVQIERPRTHSGNNNPRASASGCVSNTSKIVMKTLGGSIVPLPTVQTLVSRRALPPGVTTSLGKITGGTTVDATRKHRLSDLNVQIKQVNSDASGDATVGPDAKKARYIIAMPQTSTTTGTQKLLASRPQVQRASLQGNNSSSGNSPSSSGSTNPNRRIYNLVTSSDGVGNKYMICNKDGVVKPRTVFNTTMRRGYTLADSKLRRPIGLTPQQQRFKLIKLQQQKQALAQAQAKIRQQQQQQQEQKPLQPVSQNKSQQSSAASSQSIKLNVPPAKPMFEILKPPSAPSPMAAAAPAAAASTAIDALGGSRRKHCNCSKSQCLKLYCDCFANGEFCQDCTCKDCFNNLDYEVKRERAIRSCLERNPSAFKPKITAPNSGDMRLHNKGCNCKRSGCLKNYCECYEAKIPCSSMCKCLGCRNMEDRPDVDMDSMDSLLDVKLRANKMKELNGSSAQETRSNVYLTDDVIEATIMCMISRIVMHEKQSMPIDDTEREVMEELGESLNQIITFAKEKNDTIHMDESKTTT